jgi:hypothetical protein
LFVSVGKKDGFDIRNFKDYVAEKAGISWKKIRVDVSGVYSFIDAQQEDVESIMSGLNGQMHNGRSSKSRSKWR